MLRSMYSGVSGLKVHQVKLDVIGNNIANINTTGFKTSRVTFKEMLNQTLQGASAPSVDVNVGGTNPQQIGLGVGVGSIDVDHTQGNLQPTGKTSDLAIDGNGFFVINNGEQSFYTRSGAMTLDDNGNLVNAANGYKMQGWVPDGAGTISTNDTIQDVVIPIGSSMGAEATSEVSLGKNLNSEVSITTPESQRTITIDVFDSLGAEHTVSAAFTKVVDNEWGWTISDVTAATPSFSGSGIIKFDSVTGKIDPATASGTFTFTPDNGGKIPNPINIDFSQVGQYAAPYTIDGIDADGYSKGELKSYSVNSAGIVTGNYSNGLRKPLAQLALASFNNPAGLSKESGSLYSASPNSGIAQTGAANNGGRGMILSGTLEMSNVDLAQEFTDMITAQRGFQANSKIITTSDQMLQDLVNLKR